MTKEIKVHGRLLSLAAAEKRFAKMEPSKYDRLLRTTLDGWWTSTTVLTKLTPEEEAEYKKLYGKKKIAKLTPWPVNEIIPKTTGPMLELVASHPAESGMVPYVTMRTASDKKVCIDAEYYLMLKNRHPNATWHITNPENPGPYRITVMERTVVAIAMSMSE